MLELAEALAWLELVPQAASPSTIGETAAMGPTTRTALTMREQAASTSPA